MALVSKITKTVTIPGEDVSVVIRKLSHKDLKTAAKVKQSEGVGFMREMGGELLKALREADTAAVKKIQDAQEADVTNYDRDTLLKTGIVSWSYEEPLGKKNEATDDLDEPTAKFLAAEIFEFSRPETAVEGKND
ncbi:MAG: hypothetical protein JW395_3665 [Nitrospira sp.]|nr:hypothetical protein [Nitrospira sp.]